MTSLKDLNRIFIAWSFFYLAVLIIHFAIRKVFFESYTQQYGWWVYLLGVPAATVALLMFKGGMTWSYSVGGLLCLAFSAFGYYIDYILAVPWRNPINPPLAIPYVTLYLGTIMFYWFPFGMINRRLWYVYGVMFALSTFLNIASH